MSRMRKVNEHVKLKRYQGVEPGSGSLNTFETSLYVLRKSYIVHMDRVSLLSCS